MIIYVKLTEYSYASKKKRALCYMNLNPYNLPLIKNTTAKIELPRDCAN